MDTFGTTCLVLAKFASTKDLWKCLTHNAASLLSNSINRYLDGERLSDEDEMAVVDKILAYHPHRDDKVGSGLDGIMVRHHLP